MYTQLLHHSFGISKIIYIIIMGGYIIYIALYIYTYI